MTIVNGYATLAEYKAWIATRGLAGTVGTDASDDTVIEILIEAASRYLDRETGKRFYLPSTDETRYYMPSEDEQMEVRTDPLGSVTSVSVDYSGTRSYVLLASSEYDLLPINAVLDGYPFTSIAINSLVSGAYFPNNRNSVKVVCKAGYPAIPADIKEACLSIAQSLYGARSGQSAGGRMTVTAAGVVIRADDVPSFAQRVIVHYRSWV
jgi:hypothetical protein